MRGDILLIAPLVDIAFGRKVRWWSWVALAMVLVALVITLSDRGGLHLPPLAIADGDPLHARLLSAPGGDDQGLEEPAIRRRSASTSSRRR